MNATQIVDFRNVPLSNLLFSKAESGSISGSIPKISFKRIRLAYRNDDGSVGEFVMMTPPNLLSYGLQENLEMGTGQVNGYQFPICLWNRNGASPEEHQFVETFNSIVEYCKRYLVDHRDEIEKYDLELNDLKKFNPLYWKMDKGKIVEDRGPMMYIKVMNQRTTEKIQTFFINDETNTFMDPMELRNKRCYVTAAIKFESIFIGNKISLQIKLKEAVVRPIDTSIRSLLRPLATYITKEENEELQDSPLTMTTSSEPLLSEGHDMTIPIVAPSSTSTTTPSADFSGGEEEESSEEEDEEDEEDEDVSISISTTTTPTTQMNISESTIPVHPVQPIVSSSLSKEIPVVMETKKPTTSRGRRANVSKS